VERDKPKKSESVVQPIPILMAYLVPLDVDVTGSITAKICEIWSEFNIFCTLVTTATAAILNLFNPQKLPHTMLNSLQISQMFAVMFPVTTTSSGTR
jgi:hypothetical protein